MSVFRRLSFGALAASTVLIAFVLAGCAGDEGPRVTVGDETLTAEPTSTATSTGTGEATPAEATPTPGPTETPTATETATATPSTTGTPSGGGEPDDLAGVPFSTSDVRAAMEGAGYTFNYLEDRTPLCADASVAEHPFWAGSTQGGTDYGFVYVLWLYPDEDALEADWAFEDGRLLSRAGCELPNGFVYFNANAVIAFDTWHSGGADTGPTDDSPSPGEHPAVEAFLSMTP